MKSLIVYYSFTKNNEKLANHLKTKLVSDIAKIETVKRRNGFSILFDLIFNRTPLIKSIPYSLADYEHVIFIAPIWAGKIAMPLKSFLAKEKTNIHKYSFITLCGGGPGQQRKIYEELEAILQRKPLSILELRVNDLLPIDQKNTVTHTSRFRIEADGFDKFENQIGDFIKEILPLSISDINQVSR